MGYQTFIFDIDGTLIDSSYPVLYALQQSVYQTTGKWYAFEELYFALGIPSPESVRMLAGDDKYEETMRLGKQYFSSCDCNIPVFEGIEETLSEISDKGALLGIVTSKTAVEFSGFCRDFSISSYFSCCVNADDTPYHKPSPNPLLHCMQQFDAAPDTVLYIGDSVHDMECAHSAGVDFALALWGCCKPQEIRAEHRLLRPQELIPLVKSV